VGAKTIETLREMTHPADNAKRAWFEPATAILMALATLGTAWSSYQSSRWSSESNGHSTEVSHLEREAMKMHLEMMQREAAQTQILTQWLNAHLAGQQAIADFYKKRFPPELRKAFDAWMGQNPFENEKADPQPMVASLYTSPLAGETKPVLADAATHDRLSRESGQHAARYLGNTVLLAGVLFFSGTATRFEKRQLRHAMFFFACALFAYSAVRIGMLPVN
jgi:hypothetical protein